MLLALYNYIHPTESELEHSCQTSVDNYGTSGGPTHLIKIIRSLAKLKKLTAFDSGVLDI